MTQLDPNMIYEKLVTLGEEWADARYGAEVLDDSTKPLVAILGTKSGEKSQNAREAFAYAHDEYKKHIEAKAEARRKEASANVKYRAAITWSELLRTVEANHRASMRA